MDDACKVSVELERCELVNVGFIFSMGETVLTSKNRSNTIFREDLAHKPQLLALQRDTPNRDASWGPQYQQPAW